jgi:UPF0716 protein FxsA
MAGLILLLFITVPIAEIALFIAAGERIGIGATVLLVLLTAVIGTALLRHQGLRALRRAEAALQRNELPVDEALTGICLLFAGALLLTPGFLTDAIGFALLVPQVRRLIGGLVFRTMLKDGRTTIWTAGGAHYGRRGTDGGSGTVIDGEFHEVDADKKNDGAPPRIDQNGKP